jgi:glycosyltransferase involved in cell wall biosynthesis
MKVCISTGGMFHAYHLARQLNERGCLSQLYTAYPKWKVDGLPDDKVKTFPWLMIPAVAYKRWTGQLKGRWVRKTLDWWATDTFDRFVRANLEPCDIFHHISTYGLYSQKVAREQFGSLIICDRGLSHIVFQDEILADEYERWGLPYQPIDRRMVERELQEYLNADLIVVPSTFAYRSFIEKGVCQNKLVKLPLGVDLLQFRPVPKQDRIFRVIFVGALSLQKGIPYLLEAVAPLQRLRDFEVWLIGSLTPEIRPFLDKYQGFYRYMGQLSKGELYQYYSQGSVFVMPSIQEGFGMVQAEAMACGLPVIATSNTGAEDLFSNGVEGFILPIRRPDAIREKILYLYEHPEMHAEMRQAALQKVASLKGWDTYGERIVDVYQKALLPQT